MELGEATLEANRGSVEGVDYGKGYFTELHCMALWLVVSVMGMRGAEWHRQNAASRMFSTDTA